MAEVVGVVSSAITFATLAIQVGKSVQILKDYWDAIRDAPGDLKWLVREIEVLSEPILAGFPFSRPINWQRDKRVKLLASHSGIWSWVVGGARGVSEMLASGVLGECQEFIQVVLKLLSVRLICNRSRLDLPNKHARTLTYTRTTCRVQYFNVYAGHISPSILPTVRHILATVVPLKLYFQLDRTQRASPVSTKRVYLAQLLTAYNA
ncbi:hypothetical protein N7444_003577 [Penicillium canescens]|nr:hypothetical protein N7444_003577 [Penicillium canescens]